MSLHRTWLPLVLLGLGTGSVCAQRPATTVQLPTLSSFSVGTTVTVPDRGSAYLGGVKRAYCGRNEFGVPMLPFRPFRNSGIGREVSASGVHVTATIHDFEAMDEFLLSRPTSFSQSGQARPPLGVAVTPQSSPSPRSSTYGPSWDQPSVAAAARQSAAKAAEARTERFQQRQARAGQAEEFFRRGQKMEAAGKTSLAKIFYEMALQRATGQLQRRVDARLQAMSLRDAATKVARSRP